MRAAPIGNTPLDETLSTWARREPQDTLQTQKAPSLDDLSAHIREITNAHGLRNALYRCQTFPGGSQEEAFVAYTFSDEWLHHYRKSNYVFVDPVINLGARSLLPIDWAKADRRDRRAAKMFNEAREAGVGAQGLTIPVRGPENGLWALFSVTSDDSPTEWERRQRVILPELMLAAHLVHQRAYELHQPGDAIDLNAITRREKEALSWTATGRSVEEIAVLMRISGETVKAHLHSARTKLGALNRVHAVVIAMRHGLIS